LIEAESGQVLRYDRGVTDQYNSTVTYASMAFFSAAEKGPQLRSRLIEILNVPERVRLRFRFACGLVG
jgi:hypothetical protein